MSHSKIVVKNSLFLIVQPLILNFISIFVTGYIARTLGQNDYGKFVFAFAFVAMFTPIANMGLRAITVREIVEDKNTANLFLGKMVVLRFFLSMAAVVIIFLIINLIPHTPITKKIIWIASLTIIFQAIATTFQDAFQAFEKMKFIAYAQFISGAVLTLLSVIVLFIGYRLIGLTLVYCFGSFLGLLVATLYLFKHFTVPKVKIDFSFWKKNILKGVPFFYPSLVASIGTKIGIILLSKLSGDVSVGIYGAASNLTERLLIIPDGICTAIFPAMTVAYQTYKIEAKQLFQKFFLYLFLLGLPLAVGTTILAKPIINFIYGVKYQSSILVLQILIWGLFFSFLSSIQSWTLGAIHYEKKAARVPFIATPCLIIFSLLLIPHFKAIGAAVSSIFTEIISFLILLIFIKKYLLDKVLTKSIFLKVVFSNIIMAIFIFFTQKINFFLSVFAGMLIYTVSIFLFRIVDYNDLLKLRQIFIRKLEANNKL